MKLILKVIFALAAACFATLPSHAFAQGPGVSAYGALPEVSEMQISPDGKTLATIQSVGDATAVLFFDIENMSAQPIGIGLGKTNARDLVWGTNDTVLVQVSQSSTVTVTSGLKTIEFFRWFAISKTTKKAKQVFGNEPGFYQAEAGDLIAFPKSTPGKAIMARSTALTRGPVGPSRIDDGDVKFAHSLFEVNLKNGRERRLELGEPETYDWIVNDDGEAIARIDRDYNGEKLKIYARQPGEKKFSLLKEFEQKRGEGVPISILGMSDEPLIAYASYHGGRDKLSLVKFDLRTGDIGETVFANPDYDIDDFARSNDLVRVTGVSYTADMPQVQQLSASLQKTQSALAKAIPSSTPLIISKSADGVRMVVKVLYPDHPAQYYLYDTTQHSLNIVAKTYSALDGRAYAKKEPYDYTSPDNLNIHGYLTVPKGADKHAMPLVVLPHGGPFARDDMAFDWWSFAYASQGYLVYQPNFRGSTGYGFDFRAASYGEWGAKMQDDITNGVKKLIADGMADQNRICIVGASYGGYAAMAGATLTPELYQCAVSVNGVANLPQLLSDDGGGDQGYWAVRVGRRYSDAAKLRAVSPEYAISDKTPPIMLIYSEDDVVVPPSQSHGMRAKLNGAHRPVESVELKGEDHWLSTSTGRAEMLERSLDYLNQHIGQ